MALRIAEVPVSRSTSTVLPWRERAREKLMANVVLPTPPFPDEIGMMRLIATVRRQSILRFPSSQKSEGRGQRWIPPGTRHLVLNQRAEVQGQRRFAPCPPF